MVRVVLLVFIAVVALGQSSVDISGTVDIVGTVDIMEAPEAGNLTSDCATEAQSAWDGVGYQYTPMEMAASATQDADGCTIWTVPSNYFDNGGALP